MVPPNRLYGRTTVTEHESNLRELHHFETEKAMTEALAVLESHEPGEADYLERIYRAGNILRAALEPAEREDDR